MVWLPPEGFTKTPAEAARDDVMEAWKDLRASSADGRAVLGARLAVSLKQLYSLARVPAWRGFENFDEARSMLSGNPEALGHFEAAEKACRIHLDFVLGTRLAFSPFGREGSLLHLTWAAERQSLLREIAANECRGLDLEERNRGLRAATGAGGLMQRLMDRVAEAKHSEKYHDAAGRLRTVDDLGSSEVMGNVLRHVLERASDAPPASEAAMASLRAAAASLRNCGRHGADADCYEAALGLRGAARVPA